MGGADLYFAVDKLNLGFDGLIAVGIGDKGCEHKADAAFRAFAFAIFQFRINTAVPFTLWALNSYLHDVLYIKIWRIVMYRLHFSS